MKSLLIGTLAATAGLLLCACSGPGSSAAPRAAATAQPAASAQPSSATASAAGSSAGSTTAGSTTAGSTTAGSTTAGSAVVSPASPAVSSQGAAPQCLSRYLGTKITPSGDAGDSVYVNIDFTNLDNVPCTLYGYPGVSLAGGLPVTRIGLPSLENLATPRQLVTLQPGGIAYAQLQIVQAATYLPALCQPRPADYLDIIPPNQTVAIPTYYAATACAKPVHLLTVDAVQLGTNH
ncbi:MAG: DUF4232 domain-containing protein [Streptosporangiaceae bacterium]